jgi:hypothetical protein
MLPAVRQVQDQGRCAGLDVWFFVDLDFLHTFAGEEFREGKIRAEQEEEFGFINRAIGSAVTTPALRLDIINLGLGARTRVEMRCSWKTTARSHDQQSRHGQGQDGAESESEMPDEQGEGVDGDPRVDPG